MNSQYRDYQKSGVILASALDYAATITRPGIKLITIAEKIENFIRNKAARPAFPVNISINEIAAHYSPIIEDASIVPEKSIVKIDAGVSVNGYLTDAARTFVFDEKWEHMSQVAKKALDAALKYVKPNMSVYKIGALIEEIIRKAGFKPVVNLSGHSMFQYSLHGGLAIPNYKVPKNARIDSYYLNPGTAYAIEPFVTTGIGRVNDDKLEAIYRQFRSFKPKAIPTGIKEIYNFISEHFSELPFSWRWVYNEGFSLKEIEIAKKQLLNENIIHGYPVLVEAKKAPVTQFEDTIYIKEDSVEILTRKEKKDD